MMDLIEKVALWALFAVLGLVGYFLKLIHMDVRKNVSDIGKLRGHIDLLEQRQTVDVQQIKELQELKLETIKKEIEGLSEQISNLTTMINTFFKNK